MIAHGVTGVRWYVFAEVASLAGAEVRANCDYIVRDSMTEVTRNAPTAS